MRASHHPTSGARDGRNVDPELGALLGEGCAAARPGPRAATPRRRAIESRERLVPRATAGRSYYGLPLLKEPVWQWYVPAYFFAGGLAGAAAVLGAAAQLRLARQPGAAPRQLPGPSTASSGAAASSPRRARARRGAPHRGPRPAGALPQHAAGVPAHLAHEHGDVVPHRVRRRCAASTLPRLAAGRGAPGSAASRTSAAFGAGLMGLPLCTATPASSSRTPRCPSGRDPHTLPVLFGAVRRRRRRPPSSSCGRPAARATRWRTASRSSGRAARWCCPSFSPRGEAGAARRPAAPPRRSGRHAGARSQLLSLAGLACTALSRAARAARADRRRARGRRRARAALRRSCRPGAPRRAIRTPPPPSSGPGAAPPTWLRKGTRAGASPPGCGRRARCRTGMETTHHAEHP